jgi:hypothetical protein
MKIAYIAGPYRAPTVFGLTQNIQCAREVAAEFWRMGYAVICPHMNSALMDGLVPDGVFLAGDHEFLRRMRPGDVFVLLPGWSKSDGTKAELALAVLMGLTVVEWSAVEGRARKITQVGALLMEALA